jgi:D-beta-D-heptose 7-phosphate kinase/D-beta-D-heptose 1-phosphate adenosyltransferase
MIAQDWNEAKAQVDAWKSDGLKVVFTNGCFDILHRGHVEYLADTKACGDRLVLALNSDRSVRELKGDSRPIQNQDDRAAILNALSPIDMVVVFDEDTPADIVKTLIPDVLAKGGDYIIRQIPLWARIR